MASLFHRVPLIKPSILGEDAETKPRAVMLGIESKLNSTGKILFKQKIDSRDIKSRVPRRRRKPIYVLKY